MNKQRLFAGFIFLGAGFLLFRTIRLISQGYLSMYTLWAAGLLLLEFLILGAALLGAVRWFVSSDGKHDRFPLMVIAAGIFLHAFRVGIYVLGRIGPWKDFEIRPEYRALFAGGWSMFWVIFTAVMSVLGMIGVIIVWRMRKKQRGKNENQAGFRNENRNPSPCISCNLGGMCHNAEGLGLCPHRKHHRSV